MCDITALGTSNATDCPPSFSVYSLFFSCYMSALGLVNFTSYMITNILFLPMNVLILHVGYRRRQPSAAPVSHCDLITYQVVVLELLHVVVCVVSCCGIYNNLPQVATIIFLAFPVKLTAQMLFHILTCMERYLAVVHPITYLSLKTATGIRLRNAAIVCAWLLSFASMGMMAVMNELVFMVVSSSTVTASLLLISFFSVSVLCVLNRPGPGGVGSERPAVHQSKLKAFYTIVSILGVLLLKGGANMLMVFQSNMLHLGKDEKCVLLFSVLWLCVPSSLLLPVMFLQRAGKLPFCKGNVR